MRRVMTAGLLALLLTAAPAGAQSAGEPPRLWISAGGGAQPAGHDFSDAFERTLYTEKEQVAVKYSAKSGPLIAASGGYMLWKQFTIGLGVTYYTHSGSSAVSAQLPHPFFDNTRRAVDGSARTTRSEAGVHLLLGWMLPVTSRVRVLLTAGPSVLNVQQLLVTDVTYSEAYPYDTAIFTGTTNRNASHTAAGFNAGADLFWMFSRSLGAGALVQATHARARLSDGDRSVSVNAGGAQAAAGLRFRF
jgi:hypothetical protein